MTAWRQSTASALTSSRASSSASSRPERGREDNPAGDDRRAPSSPTPATIERARRTGVAAESQAAASDRRATARPSSFFERLTTREQLEHLRRRLYRHPGIQAGWTRCWSMVGADRQGGHPGREALRWPGAAAVHRLRADPRPGDRVPGRAVGGARPAGQAEPLGRAAGRSTTDGKTVVLTTHYMDEAEDRSCDRVAADHGQRQDPPARAARPSWCSGLDAPVRISRGGRRADCRRPTRSIAVGAGVADEVTGDKVSTADVRHPPAHLAGCPGGPCRTPTPSKGCKCGAPRWRTSS